MKKVCLFTIFFYVLTFCQPPQVKAVMLVDDAMIGTAILTGITIAGIYGTATYYQQTGKNPYTALLDGLDYVFQPAVLAFKENFVTPETFPAEAAHYVGVEAQIGAKLSDMIDFIKDTASGLYQGWKDLIARNTTTNLGQMSGPAGVGDIFSFQGQNYQITGETWVQKAQAVRPNGVQPTGWIVEMSGAYTDGNGFQRTVGLGQTTAGGPIYVITTEPMNGNDPYYTTWRAFQVALNNSEDEPSYPPAAQTNVAGVKEDADQDLQNNPSAPWIGETPDVLKNMPEDQLVKSGQVGEIADGGRAEDLAPPVVSGSDVKKFFGQNAAAVASQAVAVANDPTSTAQQIAAAQTAAAAAAQTAANAETQAEPQPETFTPIAASPFATPYSPGQFDIPLRFAQFLGNIRNSGLFSLPSSFFNSLPGGGSPVYEIEAGQYGHHTVDLSQTLSTGLAVLKTILLACFGFLAIRAVVMKR